MARYRLRAGERSRVYAPGEFVSAAYARRYPGKVQRVPVPRPKRRPPPRRAVPPAKRKPPARAPVRVVPGAPEEWEVTIRYASLEKKQIEDITVRMVARQPGHHTRADVRAAFWVAHMHGANALQEWYIEGVDWRDYHYPSARVSVDEVIENLGGIIHTVGMDRLRVDRVEDV